MIQPPPQRDEADRKLELLVGKILEADAHNAYFLAGKIEARDIPGWGFTRYVVEKIGHLAGTRMAVDPGTPKVARFIPLRGEPFLIRYNSRLPVVVYVPGGAEVHLAYRGGNTQRAAGLSRRFNCPDCAARNAVPPPE